jgi:hypothetical protein
MDVKCVVCGEPWDFLGIVSEDSDMEKWEVKLFRAGAGCPCCKGEVDPESRFHPEGIDDVEFGDEDPIERIFAYEDSVSGVAPKWEKPPSKSLWKCNGCEVEVLEDANGDIEFRNEGIGLKWYVSHNFKVEDFDREPDHVFQGGQKVCMYCMTHCSECLKTVSHTVGFDDAYDDGNCFPSSDGHFVYCPDCLPRDNEDSDDEEESEED